ncbi:hypothetical protein JYU34_015302 [Plutella xylostella]|uniref:Uncharacterized protein n=1 Tax=Plutella xylostella TaxID=51655 RepID=A0ABQ7QAI1_PLUXY|nr:hypothetical protein JYU34_015302 [Plutella xylostella]
MSICHHYRELQLIGATRNATASAKKRQNIVCDRHPYQGQRVANDDARRGLATAFGPIAAPGAEPRASLGVSPPAKTFSPAVVYR